MMLKWGKGDDTEEPYVGLVVVNQRRVGVNVSLVGADIASGEIPEATSWK